jgi:hypothetical protein
MAAATAKVAAQDIVARFHQRLIAVWRINYPGFGLGGSSQADQHGGRKNGSHEHVRLSNSSRIVMENRTLTGRVKESSTGKLKSH